MIKPEIISTNAMHCKQCDKKVQGRSDKKFCDDNCRNAFNRHKREQLRIKEHENMPEIFRIIKRNYEILKFLDRDQPVQIGKVFSVDGDQLKEAGFNPKFSTSVLVLGDEVWKFCFERGWKENGAFYDILDLKKQAEIK